VNYSENDLKEIPDLSKHRFLKRLILDRNKISKIEGIYKNSNLTVFYKKKPFILERKKKI